MECIEYWQNFQVLISGRPDYRTWLHCKDPKEKALRLELLRLQDRFNRRVDQAKRILMPATMTDVYLIRAALHIDQYMAFNNFLETLFENFLRNKDDENMSLLFSFLDMYAKLLETEIEWSQK